MAADAVAEAWSEHDARALARLTPDGRAAQRAARRALLDFVEDYREAAKQHDEQAVNDAPEWQVVAGMTDLLEEMCETVNEAIADAGDLDD